LLAVEVYCFVMWGILNQGFHINSWNL